MSYPFYIRPITIDSALLFDGGLYNNFPTNIMYDELYPDLIIGSSVTENTEIPNDDNVFLQLRNMLMKKSNFSILFLLKYWFFLENIFLKGYLFYLIP
jgi:NTE family protein